MASLLPQQIILIKDHQDTDHQRVMSQLETQGITLADSWSLPLAQDQQLDPKNSLLLYLGTLEAITPLEFIAPTVPTILILNESLEPEAQKQLYLKGFAGCLHEDELHSAKALVSQSLLHFQTLQLIKAELKDTQVRLEERKQIERAKGILMSKHQYNESEAYGTLRKLSMDRAQRMGEVAKEILQSNTFAPK